MNKKTKLMIRSGVRLAHVCVVLALITGARAEGPAFKLEGAIISNGGGVLSNGSIIIVGQAIAGKMSSKNFTLEVGFVPIIAGSASCPASSEPVAELIGPDISTKNRFLSFTAGDPGQTQGVKITFGTLPEPFNIWDGAELWVGPSSEISENGSSVEPLPGFANFNAATLQCTPFYTDYSSLGLVHVFHEGIVPLGTYTVQVIDQTCDVNVASNFSSVLALNAAKWGDTLKDLSTDPPGPPDGLNNIVDALGIIQRFASQEGSILKPRADLEPGCLDLKINITDVLASITGFQGLEYSFEPTAADPCDSTCNNPLP